MTYMKRIFSYEIISDSDFDNVVKKLWDMENSKVTYPFVSVIYIKGDCMAEFTDMKKVYHAVDIIRTLDHIVIWVIDGKISFSLVDCLIAADICIAAGRGRFNLESEYASTGIFTKKQIAFLLGMKIAQENWWRKLCQEDGKLMENALINYRVENLDKQMLQRKFLHPLLFEKSEEQVHQIKSYFNHYKTADWNQRDVLKEEESKSFCILSSFVSNKEMAGRI